VLFTVITVPIGIGLAMLQLLGHPTSGEFIVVIAACLAISLLVLLTRPGRVASPSTRSHEGASDLARYARRRLSPEK
jgi:hypothetical protein